MDRSNRLFILALPIQGALCPEALGNARICSVIKLAITLSLALVVVAPIDGAIRPHKLPIPVLITVFETAFIDPLLSCEHSLAMKLVPFELPFINVLIVIAVPE